jgi:dihydrofolate reductase
MNGFIVAVDEKWGIAKDHKIPWYYKEDFAFFKEMTLNSHCILGYNTYKEIAEMRGYPEKTSELLPKRKCYVLTSKDIPETDSVSKHSSFDAFSNMSDPFMFIGGTSIYNYGLEQPIFGCQFGYITRIKKDYDCNTFFNHELLEKDFELAEVIKETEDLRFERWIRKATP